MYYGMALTRTSYNEFLMLTHALLVNILTGDDEVSLRCYPNGRQSNWLRFAS